MKTNQKTFKIILILTALGLSACATNPADDQFTAEELQLLNSDSSQAEISTYQSQKSHLIEKKTRAQQRSANHY